LPLVLFAVLQIIDVITTNHALAIPGNWEANPLMALSQSHLGAVWWLPKVAAFAVAAIVASRIRRRWPMIFAVAYYEVIVSGNLVCL
jgi:hypothetical protein